MIFASRNFDVIYCAYLYLYVYSFTRQLVYQYLITIYLKVIATGVNRVTRNTDPTAHAEVTAIRKASKKLGTFDLAGCDIYTSCEPCPMCLGAVYWAHIDRMYYGNTKADAKNVGFDDSFIYDEIELKPEKRRLITTQLLSE